MVDYAKTAAKAKTLIEKYGRTVTLVRPNETPDDPNKPWLGSNGPDTTLQVPAVQVLPNQVRVFELSALGDAGKLEELISISEFVYIVFQGENDLKKYTFVRDGGIDRAIVATQALKPADVTLLGYILVRR